MSDYNFNSFDQAVAAHKDSKDDQYDFSHFDNAASDPSTLEALARGGAQGATLGFEPAISGAIQTAMQGAQGNVSLSDVVDAYRKNRDTEKAANDAAAKAHPTANVIGNLVGSLAPALLSGGSSEVASAPGLINAIKTGATIGGVAGLGTSDADLTKGEIGQALKDTLSGAGSGALMGAVTEGALASARKAGGLIKNAASGLADTDLVQMPVQAAKLGYNEGISTLTNKGKEAAKELAEQAASQVGNTATDLLQKKGKELGAEYEKIANLPADIRDQLGKLKDTIEKLRQRPGSASESSANKLQKIFDDIVKGKATTVDAPFSTLGKTVEATPSAMQKLEAEAAKLKEQAKQLGQNLDTQIVQSADEKGNKFLTLLKKTDENIDATERAIPIKDENGMVLGHDLEPGTDNFKTNMSAKTVPDVPGSPEQFIPGQVQSNPVQINQGGINPEAAPIQKVRDLQSVLTQAGGLAEGEATVPDLYAKNMSKTIAQQLGSAVDNASENVGPLKQQYSSLKQGLQNLGIGDEHWQLNPETGVEELTPQGLSKLSDTITRSARSGETATGSKADRILQDTISRIKQINPTVGEQLEQQVGKAADVHNLVQKTQGFNLYNKSTFLKSGLAAAGNVVGLGAREVSNAISPITNNQLAQAAKQMVSSGSANGMKVAQMLADAMKKDNVGRNAALFSLMQQPEYRDLLQKHLGSDTPNQ